MRLFSKIWGKFTRKTKFSLWRTPERAVRFLYLRFKRGHKLKLKEVRLVLAVDNGLFVEILDKARSDIDVQLGIGKAEIFLVGLAAEAVNGGLVHKDVGNSQNSADLLDLGDRKV